MKKIIVFVAFLFSCTSEYFYLYDSKYDEDVYKTAIVCLHDYGYTPGFILQERSLVDIFKQKLRDVSWYTSICDSVTDTTYKNSTPSGAIRISVCIGTISMSYETQYNEISKKNQYTYKYVADLVVFEKDSMKSVDTRYDISGEYSETEDVLKMGVDMNCAKGAVVDGLKKIARGHTRSFEI